MSTMRRLVPFEELTKDDLREAAHMFGSHVDDMNVDEEWMHVREGLEHQVGKLRGVVNHLMALSGEPPYFAPEDYTDEELEDGDEDE